MSGVRNDFGGTSHGPVMQAGQMTVHYHPAPPLGARGRVPLPDGPFVNRKLEFTAIDGWTVPEGDGDGDGDWDTVVAIGVLNGPPGMGKRQVIRRWTVRRRDRFAGGDLYVDFAKVRDVSAGVTSCLRQLGVADAYLPSTYEDLTARYREMTAGGAVLVVLDHVTDPAQVRALLPGTPGSVVLATSAGRLGELQMHGAQLMELEPLTPEHGRQVLERYCGAERVAAKTEDADRIVAACGGLPLALQVAGIRLREEEGRGLAAFADELAVEERALSALTIGGKRIVTAVFDMAYEGLSAEAARLYRILGRCPATRWDVALAAALAETDAVRTGELLAELEGAGLVGRHKKRYGLHEVVRLHAAHLADSVTAEGEGEGGGEHEGPVTVVGRAIGHLLRLAAHADRVAMGDRMRVGNHVERLGDAPSPFADKGAALDWLDEWRGELLAVVRAAVGRQMYRPAWELAEALTALYLNRRYLTDWLASGEAGVIAAVEDGNAAAEARLRSLLSRPLLDRDEKVRAREELDLAIVRADAAGEGYALLRASVREFDGRYWDLYEPDRATSVYEEALALYWVAGDPRGIAIGLYFLGCAQQAAGLGEKAAGTLEDACGRFVAIGDLRMGARVLAALGIARRGLGLEARAEADLEEAAQVLKAQDAEHYEAQAREVLAELAAGRGDARGEERQMRRALEIYEKGGSPRAELLRRRLDDSGEEA